MKIKKIISALLALTIAVTALPLTVFSAESTSDGAVSAPKVSAPAEGSSGFAERSMTLEEMARRSASSVSLKPTAAGYGNQLSYRNHLTAKQKKYYDIVCEAAANRESWVTIYDNLYYGDREDGAEMFDIFYAVYNDHPEFYWMEPSCTATFRWMHYIDGVYTEPETVLEMDFNGLEQRYDYTLGIFEKAIAPAINKAATFTRDVDKEKFIHDYLTNTINYVDGASYNQSAYSAVVYKRTVCAGYSRAFQYCMHKLGINCAFVTGYAGDSYSYEAHSWNIVELDGEYYLVDVTWDDPIGNDPNEYIYDYFNVTDAELSGSRVRDDVCLPLPEAKGTRYYYYNIYGDKDSGSSFSDLSKYPTEIVGVVRRRGDLNGDGVINARDVSMLLRAIAYFYTPDYGDTADYDSNGMANSRDASRMLKDIAYKLV